MGTVGLKKNEKKEKKKNKGFRKKIVKKNEGENRERAEILKETNNFHGHKLTEKTRNKQFSILTCNSNAPFQSINLQSKTRHN